MFSVVIATLNAAGTIGRCLDGVLGQIGADVEVVVVDGGSSDATLDIVAERCGGRCIVLRGRDRGIYDAWNKALDVISGDWVLFLGADDVLAGPAVLQDVDERLRAWGTEPRLVYGKVELVDSYGTVLGALGRPWDVASREVARSMPVPNPAVFYRADLFREFGGFDPSYRSSGDYEFFLRVVSAVQPCFLDGLTVTRMGAGGISSDARFLRRRLLEDLRAQRAHGFAGSCSSVVVRRAEIEVREGLSRVLGRSAVHRLANVVRRLRGRPSLPRLPGRSG